MAEGGTQLTFINPGSKLYIIDYDFWKHGIVKTLSDLKDVTCRNGTVGGFAKGTHNNHNMYLITAGHVLHDKEKDKDERKAIIGDIGSELVLLGRIPSDNCFILNSKFYGRFGCGDAERTLYTDFAAVQLSDDMIKYVDPYFRNDNGDRLQCTLNTDHDPAKFFGRIIDVAKRGAITGKTLGVLKTNDIKAKFCINKIEQNEKIGVFVIGPKDGVTVFAAGGDSGSFVYEQIDTNILKIYGVHVFTCNNMFFSVSLNRMLNLLDHEYKIQLELY